MSGLLSEVHRLQEARRHAQEECRHAPLSLVLNLPRRKTHRPRKGPPQGEEIAEAVGTTLREGIELRWRELLEVEQVLQEIAEEFDGEDPARPRERQVLTQGKNELKELHEQVQEYVGPFDLPGPDEEETEQMREAIRRAAER